MVQTFNGIIPAREMERPERTFVNWYRRKDDTAFSFNTRAPIAGNGCLYVLSNIVLNPSTNGTLSEYFQMPRLDTNCKSNFGSTGQVRRIQVHKTPDHCLWDKVRVITHFCQSCSIR